jgi:hypothetical protein
MNIDKSTIEHEFLKHKGFETIDIEHGIKFQHKTTGSLLNITYNKDKNTYNYIYRFDELLNQYGSHKANINPQSYKLFKRSRTIKSIIG